MLGRTVGLFPVPSGVVGGGTGRRSGLLIGEGAVGCIVVFERLVDESPLLRSSRGGGRGCSPEPMAGARAADCPWPSIVLERLGEGFSVLHTMEGRG